MHQIMAVGRRRVGAGLLLAMAAMAGQAQADDAGWASWGGGLDNSRSAVGETVISTATAPKLAVQWTYTAMGNVSQNPTVENSDLYITDEGGYVHKLDRSTGKLVWKHALSEFTGLKGSYSRSSPTIGAGEIIVTDRAMGHSSVLALDKSSGALLWKTAVETSYRSAQLTGSPIVYNGIVYVGVSSGEEVSPQFLHEPQFRGSLVALNEKTGKILWRFNTVPEGYNGGAVWSSTPVVDPQRGSLYITTGNNTHMPDSVARCVEGTTDPDKQIACMSPNNYFDSVVALDLVTGKVKWGHRLNSGADAWFLGCLWKSRNCQALESGDYDFGSGANLYSTMINGKLTQVLGAGQKSGVYWALNPDDGSVLWSTLVGPGSSLGGIEWGSATDGNRVYVAIANGYNTPFALDGGTGAIWNGGAWAALDASTGAFLWQIAELGFKAGEPTAPSTISSALTVANGVMFAGTSDGQMVALDGATGAVLWTFQTPGTVMGGPTIVDGTMYWGTGFSTFGAISSNLLYSFTVAP